MGRGLGEPDLVPSRAGWFSHHKGLPLAPSSPATAGVTGYLPTGPELWEPLSCLEPPSLPLHHCLQLWPNGELGEEEEEARSRGKQLQQAKGFEFLTLLFKYLFTWLRWVSVVALGTFTVVCGIGSLTKHRTQAPAWGAWSLSYWTPRKAPAFLTSVSIFNFLSLPSPVGFSPSHP